MELGDSIAEVCFGPSVPEELDDSTAVSFGIAESVEDVASSTIGVTVVVTTSKLVVASLVVIDSEADSGMLELSGVGATPSVHVVAVENAVEKPQVLVKPLSSVVALIGLPLDFRALPSSEAAVLVAESEER